MKNIFFFFLLLSSQTQAMSLHDALSKAYLNYPGLLAERSTLHAANEGIAAARGGYKPQLNAIGSAGRDGFESKNKPLHFSRSGRTHPKSIGGTIEQPLYQFGRLSNALKKSEHDVLAAKAQLKLTEQDVFLSVIDAYLNTIRDEAIVKLSEKNVAVLQKTYNVSKVRFDVGQMTQTDLAQAEAYLEEAKSILETAKVGFLNTTFAFERLVGEKPRDLQKVNFTLTLPLSLEEALLKAEKDHPLLHGAEADYKSAYHEAERIKSDLYPALSLKGTGAIAREASTAKQTDKTYSVMAEVKIPIYSGGITEAKTRGARHIARQKMLLKELRFREVKENVMQAFEAVKASDAQIAARLAAVRAQSLTAEGTRYQLEAGLSTIVDVAETERDLLAASVELTKAKTSALLAKYTLLAALGKLNAADLGLDVAFYDPEKHTKYARKKWFGTKTSNF